VLKLICLSLSLLYVLIVSVQCSGVLGRLPSTLRKIVHERGTEQPSLRRQNSPACTKLQGKFKKFPGCDPREWDWTERGEIGWKVEREGIWGRGRGGIDFAPTSLYLPLYS